MPHWPHSHFLHDPSKKLQTAQKVVLGYIQFTSPHIRDTKNTKIIQTCLPNKLIILRIFLLTGTFIILSCPPVLTCAGLLWSMSGSDYPPHCLICLSVWAVSSLWCSSSGSWPLVQTTGLAIASSLTSGPPLTPSGWAWPWPSLCLGCKEWESIYFLSWSETDFVPIVACKLFNLLSVQNRWNL